MFCTAFVRITTTTYVTYSKFLILPSFLELPFCICSRNHKILPKNPIFTKRTLTAVNDSQKTKNNQSPPASCRNYYIAIALKVRVLYEVLLRFPEFHLKTTPQFFLYILSKTYENTCIFVIRKFKQVFRLPFSF